MVFFPRNEDRESSWPRASVRVKSGAVSPADSRMASVVVFSLIGVVLPWVLGVDGFYP